MTTETCEDVGKNNFFCYYLFTNNFLLFDEFSILKNKFLKRIPEILHKIIPKYPKIKHKH